MRRLVAWVTGAAGGLAAYRLLRRHRAEPEADPAVESDERAEELRAKLAETRESDELAEAEPAESPEERRRRVHEEGRSAIDEMQGEQ